MCLPQTNLPLYLCLHPLHNSTSFSYIPKPHPHTFFPNHHPQSHSRLQHTTMGALYLLAIIVIAMLYGTWAQVVLGGRMCIGATRNPNFKSTTTNTPLRLCDDAELTMVHNTFSITTNPTTTTTNPSTLEASNKIIQGTEVYIPSWILTSLTGQPSSTTTDHILSITSETPS